MTTLLQEALAEANSLPDAEQDFLASLMLASIRDTQRWDATFASSKDVLEELYDEAMKEYREGRTTPINA